MAAQENAGRRASRRLQHVLEKKASKMLFKASQTTGLGLSLPSSRRSQPQLSASVAEDAAPDEQEMDNYLLLAAGLHKLMQYERALVARILPQALRPQVLEATVRDAMDLVVHDGESIAARAKRCIARRDFSAVLFVFPILKHLDELRPDLERTVEGCDYALRSKFTSVLDTLNSTVSPEIVLKITSITFNIHVRSIVNLSSDFNSIFHDKKGLYKFVFIFLITTLCANNETIVSHNNYTKLSHTQITHQICI